MSQGLAGEQERKPVSQSVRCRASAGRAAPASGDAETTPIPRAVVRLERSGRGGKQVTVVEHMAITASARDEWLKGVKKIILG